MSARVHALGATRDAAVAWLAVGAWTALVLSLSGNASSNERTGDLLLPLLQALLPFLPEAALEWLHWGLRKGAHVFFYGVLALLAARALRRSGSGAAARAVPGALAAALAVALVDETRQSFAALRTGSGLDVALDLAGAALFLAAAAHWRPPREAADAG